MCWNETPNELRILKDENRKGDLSCVSVYFQTNAFFLPLFVELNESSVYELNEILVELEAQIKENSEILIAELARRDEQIGRAHV